MVNEWPWRNIRSLGKVVTGKTPSTRDPQNFGGPYPFITIPDLEGHVYIRDTARTISERGAALLNSCLLPANAVMMSCIATVGKCGITVEPSFTNQQINSVICNNNVEPRYLYYCFRQLKFQLEATGGGGSVYTNVSKSRFSELEVPIPPLPEQRAIAHILGALDDKIELNHRMNQTLEAMAQALFKSWFVDFEPFRDQAMQDSPLGEIPVGWEVRKIGEVLELKYGKGLREDDRQPGDVPVYGSNGQVGWHNMSLVKGPGIVVGRKGNPGTVIWVPTDFFPIDTTFFVETKGPIRSMAYLFHALRSLGLPSLGADSAVPGLNRNMAYMSDILVPPAKILSGFDSYANAFMQKIYANEKESRNLTDIRDTLLPKLLSGEIQVKEAEKSVDMKL